MADGVGAPRSGRDRTAGRHASAAVCKCASVLNGMKRRVRTVAGPVLIKVETDHVTNDVTTSATAKL